MATISFGLEGYGQPSPPVFCPDLVPIGKFCFAIPVYFNMIQHDMEVADATRWKYPSHGK